MDDIERGYELRDQLDQMAQGFERAGAMEAAVGTDGARVAKVYLAANGDVTQIDIAQSWADHVEPDQLGSAIQEALSNAQTNMMTDWAQRVQGSFDAGLPRARPLPPESETFGSRVAETMAGSSLDHQVASLERAAQVLRDVNQQASLALAELGRRKEMIGVGRGVGATVRMQGGNIVDIAFDDRWLLRTSPFAVGRDVVLAIVRAKETLAEQQDSSAFDELNRLAAFTTDRRAMDVLLEAPNEAKWY